MIVSYANKLARDLVEDRNSKEVRGFSAQLRRSARRKLFVLSMAKQVKDLRAPPGNRLEKLKGDRKDMWSIRINEQWRIVFRFVDGQALDVSVEDDCK